MSGQAGAGLPLLQVRRLRQAYGGRIVLEVDEIEVGTGEVLAVLGPNGAGKSTLFRLLLGVESADAGEILLDGAPARERTGVARHRIAGVFQSPHLFAGTVAQNVGFGLVARGSERAAVRRRVAEALSWFGMERFHDANVRTLSGGEVRRVAVLRALVLEPDVLLLDEPTAGLDVTAQRGFREQLERAVRAHSGAAVLITHDPADAFALADRIVVLENGRIVQRGQPADLVLAPATPFVAAITGAELLLEGTARDSDAALVRIELSGGATLWGRSAQEATVAPDMHVHLAYRPEDVIVALPDGEPRTSAVNRVEGTITSVVEAGPFVRIRLEGAVPLTALVTRRSALDLGLERGGRVVAYLKATAVRVYPVG